MNNKIAWNDLQLILAIATSGTLSGAGRHLGVSHATVYRRLGVIERQLGVKLFNGTRVGYSPTMAGEKLAATARLIESQVFEAERQVVGRDLQPSGIVRVTTLDSFLLGFLAPIFAEFQTLYREISLEIVVSNQLINLSKRETDIAVRPSPATTQTLVGQKVGTIAYAVYCKAELAQGHGDTLDRDCVNWIGPDDTMAYPELGVWMESKDLTALCRYRINSVVGMHAAASEGQGAAVLPCYLGDADNRLSRFSEPIPELTTDLWLLTHKDLQKTARIRTFLDFLAKAINKKRSHLEGTC